MVWFGNLLAVVAIVSLLFAACQDVATRTIPNSIVAIVAVVGFTARLLMGLSAFAISAAAAVVLFIFLLLLHARGVLGGGDVKLIPAIALGLPLPSINHFVFITVMSGGVLALLHLLARWTLRGRPPLAPPPRGAFLLHRVFRAERWRIARHGSLPYGVAIACGGIWVIMSRVGS
jgi:prepilin peptidase CpaA